MWFRSVGPDCVQQGPAMSVVGQKGQDAAKYCSVYRMQCERTLSCSSTPWPFHETLHSSPRKLVVLVGIVLATITCTSSNTASLFASNDQSAPLSESTMLRLALGGCSARKTDDDKKLGAKGLAEAKVSPNSGSSCQTNRKPSNITLASTEFLLDSSFKAVFAINSRSMAVLHNVAKHFHATKTD